MRTYFFTEQPYPQAWDKGLEELRITIPNSYCDPRVAADIYHRHMDQWMLCDELGLDIMVNEHHASATCLSPSPTLHLAILARITKRARLLALGIAIANRPDPIRVAEEAAVIDVISRGRLDLGFVKGAPYELSPLNSNPHRFMERFWEAHDLILKALSNRGGPFNFEGEFHQYRQVNVWPQPWQQPTPPVWITAGSPETTLEVASRGHTLAVFLAGRALKKLIDLYKGRAHELGRPAPGPEKFAYMGLMAVAATREEAYRRAYEIQGYLRTTSQVGEPFMNPPGYMSVQGNAKWLEQNKLRGRAGNHAPATTADGRVIDQSTASIEDLISANVMFAGTADDVYRQISEFSEYVGGLGNLIVMGHGGTLSQADTLDSLTRFGNEVLPRLKEHTRSHFEAQAIAA